MQNDPHVQKGIAHEFMTCGCQQGETYNHQTCCVTPSKHVMAIGKKWASPLSGFIAGAAVASIITVPWLLALAKMSN